MSVSGSAAVEIIQAQTYSGCPPTMSTPTICKAELVTNSMHRGSRMIHTSASGYRLYNDVSNYTSE
jgi:hypothetical protein